MVSGDLERRFEMYAQRVAEYGVVWWMDNDEARARLATPDVRRRVEALLDRGETVQTKAVFTMPNGAYVARRLAQHRRIRDETFRPGAGAVPVTPAVVYLLGVPGSGKSSILGPIAREILGADSVVSRDADDVRERMPEYATGLGSEIVQDEVVDVVYDEGSLRDLLRAPHHVLIDVVGDPEWLPDEVELCLDAGRRVLLLCAEVSIELAVERVVRRAVEGGRYVSPAYVRSREGAPRQAIAACQERGLVIHGWAVFDTGEGPPWRVLDGDGSIAASDSLFQPNLPPSGIMDNKEGP